MGGRGRPSKRYRLHWGRQGKHIVGHNNYIEGRSIITIPKDRIEELFDMYHGTGITSGNKELVDFNEKIGIYKSKDGNLIVETTKGIIHYSQDGYYHVVPGKP